MIDSLPIINFVGTDWPPLFLKGFSLLTLLLGVGRLGRLCNTKHIFTVCCWLLPLFSYTFITPTKPWTTICFGPSVAVTDGKQMAIRMEKTHTPLPLSSDDAITATAPAVFRDVYDELDPKNRWKWMMSDLFEEGCLNCLNCFDWSVQRDVRW